MKALHHILRFTGFLSASLLILTFTTKPADDMSSHSILCLGDSYTIGESLPLQDNFPNQTVQQLNKTGLHFNAPEIVAKTGWTTDELQQAIDGHSFKKSYEFVTLLIGVNNQYRGRSVEEYKSEFESLLQQAIHFADGKADHVIVLSIPDWGVTPFAGNRDHVQIAKEIDEFNAANKKISEAYKVHYIDITPGTREAVSDPTLLASDGLHPSAKEYARWKEKIAEIIQQQLQ